MRWSIWRPAMAAAKPNWPDSSAFLMGVANCRRNPPKITVVQYPLGHWPSGSNRAHGSCGFYILLCMFNGFAFARPFCQAIKVSLTGVEF